jgi:hypothetical protein
VAACQLSHLGAELAFEGPGVLNLVYEQLETFPTLQRLLQTHCRTRSVLLDYGFVSSPEANLLQNYATKQHILSYPDTQPVPDYTGANVTSLPLRCLPRDNRIIEQALRCGSPVGMASPNSITHAPVP